MYLYENIESEKPKEKIKLEGAKFTRDEDKNKIFELKYRIKKGKGSWKTDTFKVQHQDEINFWRNAIEKFSNSKGILKLIILLSKGFKNFFKRIMENSI